MLGILPAKVAGKPMSISEASIRSDLLFDNTDGIDSLPNQAIFDAIQLMGYEGDLTVLTFNKLCFHPVENKEKLKEKEKGVELKDVEETERPRPTSTRSLLTLKPLPKIDPKDKGKKMIEEEDESDTDSEDITEAEKKFKQLARDEEVARKVQEDWEAEEVKKLAEEEATKAALSNEYDFIQARLNADKILAEKLQEEEREIGKKHSDLKTKGFEEIKALYDKIKRSDDSFIAIGSAEDEKVIKEINEQVADASKKRVKKDDNIKREIKEEEGTRKRKLGIRKKMKSKKRKFTSKDDEELRLCLTIVSDEDKEVDYEILDKKYPIIEWRSDNRPRRFKFSTLMAVLSILDRDDICAIYQLLETEESVLWLWKLLEFVQEADCRVELEDSDGRRRSLSVNEELAIPEQTATGKGKPNPLMAGSLPKTIKPTELDVAVLLKRQVADEDG
ncbi:hypothetical protein Tco_0997946 [Tanacetum coccineum]